MWENLTFQKNKIFAILAIVFTVFWLSITEEEYDNLHIISMDYNCKEVIINSYNVPEEIVDQCKNLSDQLRNQNAPKQSQRGT